MIFAVVIGAGDNVSLNDVARVECSYGGRVPAEAAPASAYFESQDVVIRYLAALYHERPRLAEGAIVFRLDLNRPHEKSYLDALQRVYDLRDAEVEAAGVNAEHNGTAVTEAPLAGVSSASAAGMPSDDAKPEYNTAELTKAVQCPRRTS